MKKSLSSNTYLKSLVEDGFSLKLLEDTYFSLAISLYFVPGIFSCQGLHWVVVTTGECDGAGLARSRSCRSRPITSLAGCSELPDWLPGSSTGGKQSRDQSGYHGTGPETGQVDRALWAFKKNPWNVKKLKLFASVFDRDEFFFCSQC